MGSHNSLEQKIRMNLVLSALLLVSLASLVCTAAQRPTPSPSQDEQDEQYHHSVYLTSSGPGPSKIDKVQTITCPSRRNLVICPGKLWLAASVSIASHRILINKP